MTVFEEAFVNDMIEKRLVHSIHTSERRSYRGCRRRWNWLFNEFYYPLVTAKPLEFGQAFHKAMEKYYDPMTWHDKETAAALAQAAFVQVCKEQHSQYMKLNKGNIDPEMKKDYDERIQLGLGMLRHYTKWVSPVHDVNFKPVKVEIEFEVPIKDPHGRYLACRCNKCWAREVAHYGTHINEPDYNYRDVWRGLPVTYGGRIDMLAEDELGRYWVFDWKTAARMSGVEPGSSDDFMLLDDQITSYCWALWTLGIPVVGFVYAEIKKAVPEEPEPNKTQRLGRWYSVNKQLNTTYDIYYKTVSENDPVAFSQGLYDNFLDYLKSTDGPRYHVRHVVFRSETELANAGYNIWQEASEMVDPNLKIYPSPGRFSCGNCAFKDPCLSMNKGEDFQYTLDTLFEKRVRAYWEKESSTDSKGGS